MELSADPQCLNYRGTTCSSTVRHSPTGDRPDSSTPSYSEGTCRRAGVSKSLALCRRRQGTCRVQPTDVQTCTQSRVWHQSMALVGSGAYGGTIIVLSTWHSAVCVHGLVCVVAVRMLALHAAHPRLRYSGSRITELVMRGSRNECSVARCMYLRGQRGIANVHARGRVQSACVPGQTRLWTVSGRQGGNRPSTGRIAGHSSSTGGSARGHRQRAAA